MQTQTTFDADSIGKILLVAMELSNRTWQLRFGTGLRKTRDRRVTARDQISFLAEVRKAKGRLGLPPDARTLVCFEAGRDGFWIERWLAQEGIECLVVDPASIEVDQRQRRRKTDRIDLRRLFKNLCDHVRGESNWSVCRVPTEADEDQRRLHRERDRLVSERKGHRSRVIALLITQGIDDQKLHTLADRLDELRTGTGHPLGKRHKAEIRRELIRFALVEQQLGEVEAELRQWVRSGRVDGDRGAVMAQALMQLKGVGWIGATVLANELFAWRTFRNRRELAGLVGLAPVPWDSGDGKRDQGVSRAGSRRVRSLLVELSWLWLRHQPHSELSLWFERKWGRGGSRSRKVGITALARRLVIALWRYVDQGLVPVGAQMKAI